MVQRLVMPRSQRRVGCLNRSANIAQSALNCSYKCQTLTQACRNRGGKRTACAMRVLAIEAWVDAQLGDMTDFLQTRITKHVDLTVFLDQVHVWDEVIGGVAFIF